MRKGVNLYIRIRTVYHYVFNLTIHSDYNNHFYLFYFVYFCYAFRQNTLLIYYNIF